MSDYIFEFHKASKYSNENFNQQHTLESMSGHPKIDLSVTAAAGMTAADELMKALSEVTQRYDYDTKKYYTNAEIGAAVAIGALELLRRDKSKWSSLGFDPPSPENTNTLTTLVKAGVEGDLNYDHTHEKELADRGRKMEEIAEVYSLGRELLGHKDDNVVNLMAEVLGPIATLRNIDGHFYKVEHNGHHGHNNHGEIIVDR